MHDGRASWSGKPGCIVGPALTSQQNANLDRQRLTSKKKLKEADLVSVIGRGRGSPGRGRGAGSSVFGRVRGPGGAGGGGLGGRWYAGVLGGAG